MAGPKDKSTEKVKANVGEALRKMNEEKVEALEARFGVKVTVKEVTLRELAELGSQGTSFERRIELMQSMLTEGDAGGIKLVELEDFMDLISAKVDLETNPTSK